MEPTPKRKRILSEEQKQKAYERQKLWVANNRENHNAAVRRYRAKRYAEDGFWAEAGPKAKALKEWMIEIKSNPCTDCGQRFPVCCMDFDHVRDAKAYNIGSMFAHHYSKELIEEELAKCELVCANCHRIRTRNRRTGSKQNKTNSFSPQGE